VFLPCDPNGSPKPTITWLYDEDSETTLDDSFEYFNFTIIADGLLISNVTKDHEGVYICRAHQHSKFLTHTTRKKFTLRINCKCKFVYFSIDRLTLSFLS
jgi:Immunoglobulin domain